MKFYLVLLALVISTLSAHAQTYAVNGRIADAESSEPLPGGVVMLIHLPDSAREGTTSAADGSFSFSNVANGNYLLRVVYLGYKNHEQKLSVNGKNISLGTISLQTDAVMLKEATVTRKLPPAVQRGDTTELNADAFKTNPDANAEDLVTKMPGIVVQNGKVQAQGEDVQKVLVDGKPYFGEDPNAALKNLPAEAIDKIQVFDKQSDQAAFTGVDDGESVKTINIVTKPAFRNGQFGRFFTGYGTDDRYSAGGNLNLFNNDRRISIVGMSNNINQSNFSTEDLLGVVAASGSSGGRGGPRRGRGGYGRNSSVNDFLVDQRSGISNTHALGINYADRWGKKMEVSGSYFFNMTDNNSETDIFRQYVFPQDSAQIYQEYNNAFSRNFNHRFNFRLDYEIDSNNSILFRPRVTLQQNSGHSDLFAQTLLGNNILNNTSNIFNSDLTGFNTDNSLLYRHKFAKRGRTISAELEGRYNFNEGESNLYSENNYFSGITESDTLDQTSELDRNGYGYEIDIEYTEPIGKKGLLEFELEREYTLGNSDKLTYNEPVSGSEFRSLDTTLSSSFNNVYYTNSFGTGYRLTGKKSQLMLNASYEIAELRNDQQFPFSDQLSRTFRNVVGRGMFRYNFNPKKNLRIFYRSRTNAPDVSQLQDVVNNTNPLQLTTGNPGLVQEYSHLMFMRYSSTKTEKAQSFFVMMRGQYTNNYIGNSTYIAEEKTNIKGVVLQEGAQITTPVNLSGYANIGSFASLGLPLDSQRFNLNLNVGLSYTRTPGLINNRLNYANSPSVRAGVVLSSNISRNLDFTVSSNSSINYIENTIRKELNSRYFNQTSSLKINWIFWKGIVFTTDLNHQLFTGLSEGFNQNYLLWNMSLGKKLFKNQQGEIRVSVFDLLNQNNSIQRNITETYIEDVQSNVLNRYFLLSFTYNLRNFKDGGRR